MEDNDISTYETRLAESLLIKLRNPPDKYNLEPVINYYSSFTITDDFCLNKTSENKVLWIIKKIEISKAAGIDKLSGQFLWDAVEISTRPICEICNLSISLGVFPDACKIAKLNPIYKKGKKTDPSNYRPISLLPIISKDNFKR